MRTIVARLNGLRLRLGALLRGDRREQDLRDEIAFHLAMREAQLRKSGAADADTGARRRFGSAGRIREEMRDAWAVLPRLTSLVQDCRYAARALARSGTFTTVVVLTLAFGIGANTAVFSIVNAVLIRPLGFADADRLMLLHEGVPQIGIDRVPFSPADFVDVRREARAFDAAGAFQSTAVELSGTTDEPERIQIARITAGLFPMLGVEPALGRFFSPDDDRPGHDLALISWDLWQRRYAADPSVVGRSILLDRRPYTVIGVMPASFEFPRRGPQFNSEPGEVWIPMAFSEHPAHGGGFLYSVIARLRDGATVTEARSELDVLAPRIQAQYPVALRNRERAKLVLLVSPLRDEIVGAVGAPLLMLLAAISLVLLVACANVANLLLSRAGARQHEIGLRAALGATRMRLLQLQISEPLLLAAAGGALGILVARLALRTVPAVVVDRVAGLHDVPIDLRVLAFTAGLSLATALLVAIVPFLAADRQAPQQALHESAVRTTGRRHRIQGVLVVSTVALSFVLLVGAGLFLRSFAALVASDRGFRPDGVLTASVALPWEAYATGDSVRAFHQSLLRRVDALPGVRSAALSTDLPLEGSDVSVFTPEGGPVDGIVPPARRTLVHGAYFQTLGITLRRGRLFTDDEFAENRQVAIVSAKLVGRYWPGEEPLGKRLKWGSGQGSSSWLTIVGVVNDAVDGREALATMGDDRPIHIYEPLRQLPEIALNTRGSRAGRDLRLALLVAGDPMALAGPVRHELASLDRQLAVAAVATMGARLDETIAPRRFSTILVTVFAAGALGLVSIGLYGLLGFVVSQRTREIGVRLALGAEPRLVRRLMVNYGLRLAGTGIALGFVAALGATRWLSSLLYETRSLDPLTFIAVPIVLASVALVACLLPAYRASRVDPLTALRGDA